eukprot:gene1440-4600_t
MDGLLKERSYLIGIAWQTLPKIEEKQSSLDDLTMQERGQWLNEVDFCSWSQAVAAVVAEEEEEDVQVVVVSGAVAVWYSRHKQTTHATCNMQHATCSTQAEASRTQEKDEPMVEVPPVQFVQALSESINRRDDPTSFSHRVTVHLNVHAALGA